jgi:hypothetical protein
MTSCCMVMTNSVEPIPPLLKYAEASTNTLPEWFDAVEAMLDAREPVWKLSAMFPKSMDAVNYVIKSLARRFPPEKTGDICESCGQASGTIAPIFWRVRIAAKGSEVVRSTNSMPSESRAVTYHTLCATCHRQSFSRRMGKRWLCQWGVALMILSLVAAGVINVTGTDDSAEALGGLVGTILFVPGLIMAAMSANSIRCQVSPSITQRLPQDVVPTALGTLLERAQPVKGGSA